jgi:hypothetical protein
VATFLIHKNDTGVLGRQFLGTCVSVPLALSTAFYNFLAKQPGPTASGLRSKVANDGTVQNCSATGACEPRDSQPVGRDFSYLTRLGKPRNFLIDTAGFSFSAVEECSAQFL